MVVVLAAGWLVLSGNGVKIWPVFGASNQLVAALSFTVISAWLLSNRKHIRYTIWPTIFMLITTLGALLLQIYNFLKERNYTLVVLSLILIILAVIMLIDAIKFFVKKNWQGVEIDPITNQEDYFHHLEMYYVQRKDYIKATTEFEKGLEINPEAIVILYELGLCYEKLKKVDNAITF